MEAVLNNDRFKTTLNETSIAVENVAKTIVEMAVQSNKRVNNIDGLVSEINNMKDKVNDLSSILTMIESINRKVNLLSYNTSIQAANSRDGVVFKVIADEMRVLSENVKTSLSKTNSIFKEIKEHMEKITTATDKAYDGVIKNDNNLQEISSTIEEVSATLEEVNNIFKSNI